MPRGFHPCFAGISFDTLALTATGTFASDGHTYRWHFSDPVLFANFQLDPSGEFFNANGIAGLPFDRL